MEKEYHAAEFARLAGVNKKTLLYYDEIGLFRPARVEPNGYRVYTELQFDRLALIIALRDLGVQLKDIRDYLTRSDPAQLDTMLTQQSARLNQRIEQLQQRSAMLEAIRAQNLDFLRYCGKGPQLLHRPVEHLAVIVDEAEMKKSESINVNYLTDGLNIGLSMNGDKSFLYQRRADGTITLPAGDYVCLYEDTGTEWPLLQAWAANRRETLAAWAAEHGFALDVPMYLEVDELAPGAQEDGNAPLRTLRIPVQQSLASDSSKNLEK